MSNKKSSSTTNPTAVQSTKENTMTKSFNFAESRDEQGRLVTVTVNPDSTDLFSIGTNGQEEMENGKSALRAAVDFYRFGKYSHPFTAVGLHFYANANLKAFMATNVGVVSAQYDGNFPTPRPDNDWAQLNLRNGKYYLTKFNKEYADLRNRKHDFIDAYVMGLGVDIRVLPWNVGNGDNQGLATTLMATWKETDDVKANAAQIEGYKRAQARTFVNKEIQKATKYGISVAELTGDVSGALVLHIDSGEYVPVSALPLGRYKVYEGSTPLTTVNWDGSVYAASQLKMAAGKKTWGLKTL